MWVCMYVCMYVCIFWMLFSNQNLLDMKWEFMEVIMGMALGCLGVISNKQVAFPRHNLSGSCCSHLLGNASMYNAHINNVKSHKKSAEQQHVGHASRDWNPHISQTDGNDITLSHHPYILCHFSNYALNCVGLFVTLCS